MGLIFILALASLSIAGSAAFFSVVGLAAMFSAAYWPVVVMGSSLELGKLVAASFVYRTWNTTGKLMKSYLIGAILVLMMITSLGIFGFLSQGYGESTQQLQTVQYTIEAKQREVDQVDLRLEQINRIIEAVPNNYVTKRIELQREYAGEVDELAARRAALRDTMATLQKEKLAADAHVGPIIYVADMFGVPVQEAVRFFILALIIVFDPMAVILTLATNHAIDQYQLRRKQALADAREHELQLLREQAGHGQSQEDGDTAIPAGPAPELQPPAPAVTEPVRTVVPPAVSVKAAKQRPSVPEMQAVLQQTPSKAEHSARRAAKQSQASTGKKSLREGLELDDAAVVKVGGADVHEAVIERLSAADKDLVRGCARGLPANTLAAKLGMTGLNLRKRALFIAETLNASGYQVDPKQMFPA